MIYTVTLNPAIDYVVRLDNLENGSVNRVSEEYVYPGGKGINVSLILKEFGYESCTLGFTSGFTGAYIKECLEARGLRTDFIWLKNGFSRINVKIKSTQETEINGQGPNISDEKLNELYEKIDSLSSEDILILAGSIPSTLDERLYENIMSRIREKNIKVVVDATKRLLLNALKYKPFLIKPNNYELEEMFNVTLNSIEDVVLYANKLKERGARNVLVSMGGEGALILTENGEVFLSNVPKGTVKNSVGAGDSMVAGFIAGYLKNGNYEDALRLGVASGSATAFSYDLATRDYINSLVGDIKVERKQ